MLVICIAGASMAQSGYTLRGSVADEKGVSMPFANCVLLRESDSAFAYGTTCDLDGRFELGGVVQGSYLLRVTFVGYEPAWQRVELRGDTDLGTVTLGGNATLLQTVQVTASRPLYSADGEKVFCPRGGTPPAKWRRLHRGGCLCCFCYR